MARVARKKDGFARSDVASFSIANGANGSAVAAVDLGRNYERIHVVCENCQYIPAGATLGVKVGYGNADTLVTLYQMNGGAVFGPVLPSTGSFATLLRDAMDAQRVQFILSANASGGAVVFQVWGCGSSMDD